MANQHRKYRGFATERIVADYLSSVWEFASVGRGKGKDITGVPFDAEVKARKSFNPLATIRQYQARTAVSGELGFAILRLNGQGTNAEEYACIIRLGDLLPLLKLKYGHLDKEPTEADIDRCSGCLEMNTPVTSHSTSVSSSSAVSSASSNVQNLCAVIRLSGLTSRILHLYLRLVFILHTTPAVSV